MAYLIALDDGHGMETPGKRTPYISSLGRFVHENEFNRAVVKHLDEELRRSGFETLLVAPGDEDNSLIFRTNRANDAGADAYISVHYNAFDGSFSGADPEGNEIYVYPGHTNRAAGELAACIGKYLRQGTSQNWRGINEANFHVLRETAMIAILSENGFMDNEREALLMVDPDFQREVAIEHAKGICDYFGVSYVPGNSAPSGTYIVQQGDTLWGIAQKFNTTVERLKELNPGVDPQALQIGSVLIVEGSSNYSTPSYVGRRVESIYQGELRFYSVPSWDDSDIAGYLQYGYGFPNVLAIVDVDGSPQYKVENSNGEVYYVTTSETYVKLI
ncbi:N-acetylmuramoyl-L-alanine amidase [Halobacillus naozhouensis]|uniref:N-acetylmuramoyl-L-alanine amidase n=1 Tax=Halobacillus naozhouensis TaxID=554880 RepID=A0ABY8J1M0_9BACI|nr:N-acetylmuramoyl-L-alanine amidase [Halobacillus naozhouensis]WFT76255.1 N-acetylmuramoyl-L-alanine amidase [Halobacillus naozhouensis]